MLHRFAVPYFGGAVAAVVSALALWIAGRAELTALMGVSMAPDLGWPWLQSEILQGSLWGLGYPLIVRRGFTPVRAGLVWSLAPGLLALFWLMPESGAGMLGVEKFGALTPVVVLAKNALWGWVLARVTMAAGGA